MPSVVTWCSSLNASWQPRPVFAEEEQCERSRSQKQQHQKQEEGGGEEEERRAHALATLWLL
jgi:hypothetical protein